MHKNICLYYKEASIDDRWVPGDRYIRTAIKRLLGKGPRISSLQKVFKHLCLGFDKINVPYSINKPFEALKEDDIVIILGRGRECLRGFDKPNPVVAGIGLMTHPSEWPDLFEQYPVKVYLQHSKWTENIYKKYYKHTDTWFAGINTQEWEPISGFLKSIDVLIYDKIMFNKDQLVKNLLTPIETYLSNNSISYEKITYGSYSSSQFKTLLNKSKAMIFLCEHESQGLAYQEALSMNVPVFAWEQGTWLDPNRFEFGEVEPVPASSVPFFDKQCGYKFKDLPGFLEGFPKFYEDMLKNKFNPRIYVVEHLSLEKSAKRMLQIIQNVIKEF